MPEFLSLPIQAMSINKKHILIIGGGVAGNALALFLHKASTHPLSHNHYTFAIYESYPRSEKDYLGGGLAFAPNGVAVLASLGLEEEVQKRAGVTRQSAFWTEAGTELARWEHDGTFEQNMYGMMRSTLYDILSEELQKKGLGIVYKKKAYKIEEREGKVFVQFEDGSQVEGDYLIGADGTSLVEVGVHYRYLVDGENTSVPRFS